LGELNEWAKYTLFEHSARIPLIIRVPGQQPVFPISTLGFVESVDVFPTVVEASGWVAPPLCASPASQDPVCVEGVSAMELWAAPARPWKTAAFTQFPRPDRGFTNLTDGAPPFDPVEGDEAVMGYSNSDIIMTHHSRPFLAHLSAPRHLARCTHAVCCALLCTHADRVLIGAWNPMM